MRLAPLSDGDQHLGKGMRGEAIADGTALELDLLCGDTYGFPSLSIGRVHRFSVDLFYRGTPAASPALQNDIGRQSIGFVPVDHVQNPYGQTSRTSPSASV